MKRYIRAGREPVTEEVTKLLSSIEGPCINPTTGWSGTVTYDYDGYDDVNNAYVWAIRFDGEAGSSPSVDYLYRYTGNDHRAMFMLMPDSGMPLFADSIGELKSIFRKEYSYLTKK